MPSWKPGISKVDLAGRAELVQRTRRFFRERGVLEVDTPAISRFPTVDLHLESLTVHAGDSNLPRFLITSPEYHMKRLICAGSGSIYQLGKAFRSDEQGARHNPEFTILEWYRVGWTHWQLMDEIDELLSLVVGTRPGDRISYTELFRDRLGFDPLDMTARQFSQTCARLDIVPPGSFETEPFNRDDALNFLMGMAIEPQLGLNRPVFVYDYPASQASLARIHPENPLISQRFEVFYRGFELGNGFRELTDPKEQLTRFHRVNQERADSGKDRLEIDGDFIAALESGLPDCAGVAMGFDRMVMLALEKSRIDEVICFPWSTS